MNFISLSIFFASIQLILLIICVLVFYKGKNNWVSSELLMFLFLCSTFDTLIYFDVFGRFPVQASLLLLIGIQLLVIRNFVKMAWKRIQNLANRVRNKTFLFGVYISSCIVIIVSYSIFDFVIGSQQPHIYALAISSLITLALFIGLLITSHSWKSNYAFGILLLFMTLVVTFISSAYLRSDILSLVVVNAIFIAMLIAIHITVYLESREDVKEILDDYNLTKRQREVAELLLSGMNYGQIAKHLNIAESTASKHGSDIFAKTNCKDKSSFRSKFEHYHAEMNKAID